MIGLVLSRCTIMEAYGDDYQGCRKGWRHTVAINLYKVSIEFVFNWWTEPA